MSFFFNEIKISDIIISLHTCITIENLPINPLPITLVQLSPTSSPNQLMEHLTNIITIITTAIKYLIQNVKIQLL